MTDDRDDTASIRRPLAVIAPETPASGAAADLGDLQAALDDWQRTHNRQPTRSPAVEADAHAKPPHPERHFNDALGQVEAGTRRTQAVRARLEADVRAAHARARATQAELATSQTVAEQLRVANAELRTALDATEWRVGELEAESTSHRQALLHLQQEHDATVQRLAELEQLTAAQAQIEAEHQTQRSALEADLQELRAAHAAELDAWQQAAIEREAELVAARDALAEQLAAEQLQARNANDAAATLTHRVESIESDLRAAHAQRQQIEQQLEAAQGERSALALRADELTALIGQLERKYDRLRHEQASIEETGGLKADNARLENKIVELERQLSEAASRHSAALAGHTVELNQRSEAVPARSVELQQLTEELTRLTPNGDDATSDLVAQRRWPDALEFVKSHATPGTAAGAAPLGAHPAPGRPARRPSAGDTLTGPVTIIHLEENPTLCDAARDVVARLPDGRYMNALETAAPDARRSRFLAINFLSRTHDPVEAIAAFIAAGNSQRNVLAYCADGTNGFSFGTADFFAQPINPEACVARLFGSRGTIQRLLVVTENFAVVGALRDLLSRMRSAVSAALDLRQAIDLLPMVEPDVVLIDLGLPRGEGLRLVSRLRSDPKTHDLALAILLAAPGGAGEFRQHALRAARDLPMAPTDLAEALGQRLGARRARDTLAPAFSGAPAVA